MTKSNLLTHHGRLIFHKLDAHPEAVQAALRTEIGKRAKTN